ncbi:hypothetical protein [Conexibacter sp. W3-3-2]|nr:hypothetical protein [Conexibacter sp. W3-3-2]
MRPLTLLLCLLCLLTAPAVALGQSAGDEQYQDPFGETTGQTQGGGTTTQAPDPEPQADPGSTLTDEPQITPDITAPPAVGDLQDVPQDTANRPQRLADTGIDARLFLALGVALLLAGIGLRLRTIPERF